MEKSYRDEVLYIIYRYLIIEDGIVSIGQALELFSEIIS